MRLMPAILGLSIMFQVVFAGFVICRQQTLPVVGFDAGKIHGQFIRQLALHKATVAEVTRSTLRFKSLLEKTVKNYGQKHHVMILDSKMIIAGGQDVTEIIAKELSFAMRAAS